MLVKILKPLRILRVLALVMLKKYFVVNKFHLKFPYILKLFIPLFYILVAYCAQFFYAEIFCIVGRYYAAIYNCFSHIGFAQIPGFGKIACKCPAKTISAACWIFYIFQRVTRRVEMLAVCE